MRGIRLPPFIPNSFHGGIFMSKTGFLRIALLALVMLLIQGTLVLAGNTGSVEGKVTDQDGNGITGARVSVTSPSQSTTVTTGANGFYSVLNLSPDTYTVTASKDGYDTSSVFGKTVLADQATAADITIKKTVKTIGHITTTAAASVVSKTVTGDLYAVNAHVISQYQGAVGGAETLYSQTSVVGSLPGVVRNVGGGGGYAAQGTLSLRGGSQDQVGYELEGVPLNRGFDFYNGTSFLTNGLASVELYTGGAPADAGRAMAGYINEVVTRGKYPGGADLNLTMGSPIFNHSVQADVYGATPDNRFSYYVSTLALNSSYNFGDRSNLANTSFTLPVGDAGCGAFNNNLVAFGNSGGGFVNCSIANVLNQPVSQGSYASNPFAAERDTVTNLHYTLTHNGLNDDLQGLYVVGTISSYPYALEGTFNSDPSQTSGVYGGSSGLTYLGPGKNSWPTSQFYYGQVGKPYNPALLTNLTYPTSGGSLSGVIPPTYNDSQSNQYSIEKVAYTRALTQSSFLRLYGFQMYSAWTLDQAINDFVGGNFYQLHDNSTGVTLNYQNQLNGQNLVKVIGDWNRDITLRYNYFNFESHPPDCALGGAPVACTTPGALVTRINSPGATWTTATPLDWDAILVDSFKPSDKLLFDLGLRWDWFGFQLMAMKMNGPDGIAYLSEEGDGRCLNGYNYSPNDPKIIGPNGNQNCFQILTALGGKDVPGAANWTDASGLLGFHYLSPRFGTTWTLDPRDVVRASVGRYVQTPPSFSEQYRRNPLFGPGATVRTLNPFYDGLGFTVVHNTLPQDSTNYDLSLEHEFSGGVSAKLSPYYRNTRNQILTVPFNPQSPSFVTGYNFGTAQVKGVEFLITKNINAQNGIGGTLAATYTNSKMKFNSVNGSSFINVINGTTTNSCVGATSGICGYNNAYNMNYPLEDVNGLYSPSYVQAPTSTGPSWDVAYVINLNIDARINGFDILPNFNYQSGNPYGDPLNFPDAHCNPAALVPGCTPLPKGINPRTGVAYAYYGGNGPDPYTNQFDQNGSLKGPSWWALNLSVSRDIGHNLKATILGTNLLTGVHNHGYPWEQSQNQNIVAYGDNGFYNSFPLGTGGIVAPNPANGYYGNNYFPYAPSNVLPYREYVFTLSTKI
jgi:hypothetical protein